MINLSRLLITISILFSVYDHADNLIFDVVKHLVKIFLRNFFFVFLQKPTDKDGNFKMKAEMFWLICKKY